MRYNIEFQLLSFCVLLIFAIVYFSKSRLKNIQNQIYGLLLIQSLLVNFMDFSSVIAIVHRDVAGSMTEFFTKGYLCTVVVWVAMVSVYTLSLTRLEQIFREKPRLRRIFAAEVCVTILAICVCIIMQKLFYSVEWGKVYSYGKGTEILFGFGLVSQVFCLLTIIIEGKRIPFIRRLSIYVYIGILTVVSVIQIFHPEILIVSAGSALSVVSMYFTLENPDMELIAELHEAKQEAERANRVKATFFTNMSHEIQTPVNAIIGMNEMILRQNPGGEIENYALQIEQAGRNLLSIVNDILDISKIESGKLEIMPKKYLLCSMAQELYSVAKIAADRKRLQFDIEIDEKYPRILYGDEMRVKQIAANLLSNAVKYTQKGRVILLFSYEKMDSKTLDMVIRVFDTGQGIREEQMQKLLEAFRRVEGEENYDIEDIGLGLSITKQLLEAMDGRIEVESEYGKGSIFSVHIPQEIVDDTPIGEFEISYQKDSGGV